MEEDVDRLFQCFKCGVSPPESAVRERKANKCTLKQVDSTEELSDSPPSRSKQKRKQNATNVQLPVQKFGSATVKANNFNGRKHFSPVVFYGSPHGLPPKRPSNLLRLLREIHVDLSERKKMREDVWATFPRQDEAMKYAKDHAHVHVFSYQDHMNGQRRFLVSTYEEFWQRYKNMNPRFRHHYEVIQEGSPCHLYFDLEFNKRDNTEKHGDEMVDLLISVVFDALSDKYSIQGEDDWIVELDSSTEEKFSRHLIIRLQKTAFKDNSHAGAFVAEICSRIYEARKSDERLEKLFVSKDSGSTGIPCQLFVDAAVYSRNRCFRLHLSSKAGKNSFLLPTGRFKCKNMSEEDVFMASLICNMDVDCEKLLICKMDMDCVKALDFDTEIHSDFQMQSGASRELMLNSCTSDLSRTYLMGKSPFPVLDVFVESIASVGNVSVIYIVDLRRAVYYQKCLDPDCRGYRSPLRPIPKHAIPDATIFSGFVGQNGESVDDNIACHLVANGEEHITSYGDESITDSCKKDGWWVEAVRVAEQIENMNKTLEMVAETQNTLITTLSLTLVPFLSKLSQQNKKRDKTPDGDEEDWWLAVERTLSQAELTYF